MVLEALFAAILWEVAYNRWGPSSADGVVMPAAIHGPQQATTE